MKLNKFVYYRGTGYRKQIMLEQTLIQNLAKDIEVAPEHIAREAYEVLILQGLAESPLVRKVVFKGGTALRLAYGSPRFSEDLDFSPLTEISLKDLEKILEILVERFSEIAIADLSDKRYTHFALLTHLTQIKQLEAPSTH